MQRNMGRQMRLAVSIGLLTLALVAPGVGRAAVPANTSDGGAVVGRAALYKKSHPAPPQTTTAPSPRTNTISPQAAATYFVTTTMDDAVGVPANCPAGVSTTTACSLRDAIAAATSGGDTIQFAGAGIGKTTLTGGSLILNNSVTITGPTSGSAVTVDGGAVRGSGGVPVFVIGVSAPTFSVSNLTIQNGNNTSAASAGTSFGGGAIDDTNGGNLTVLNVTFTGNTATNTNANLSGGAVYVGGRAMPTISVTRSAFTSNSANFGGGMETDAGTVTLADDTFTNNTIVGTFGAAGGFYTLTTGMVTLTNVTFTGNNGGDTDIGGGMEADRGIVTITNSAFINNNIQGGQANAGGLEVSGSAVTVIVANTLFSGNQAVGTGSGNFGEGGGIEVDSGTLIVTGSTFVGNQALNSDGKAASDGGGIDVFSGNVTVVNSTFSGNQATGANSFGGTIGVFENRSAASTVTLVNTTISGSAAGTGAGIYVSATNSTTGMPVTPVVTLTNTIVAGSANVARPPTPAVDIVGAFSASATSKNNLIGSADGTSTGIANGANGNKVGTLGAPINPRLAPLADYSAGTPAPTLPDGSRLKTLALLAGSPAIDMGDPTNCARPLPTPPPATGPFGAGGVDQRGVARPDVAGTNCDIGAFESRGFTLAPVSGSTPQSTVVTTPFPQPLAVSLTANDLGVPVDGTVVTYVVTPAANGAAATLSSPTATVSAGQASVMARANSVASSYTVTASATDATSTTFALTNLPPTITVSPTTLPNGTVNQAYSQQLTAAGTGSVAPYTFSLASGSLPTGLTLSTSGLLSGIPTVAGSATFTVTVTDINGFTGSRQYTLTIFALVTLSPTTLPNGMVSVTYSQMLTASGGSGTGYTFSLASGSLPSGLMLNPTTGVLSGTPTAAGSSTFTVTVTDNAMNTGSQQYTITVSPAAASTLKSIAFTGPNGTPLPTTLKVGQMVQITATGTFSDGSTQNLTGQVQWSSRNAQIVKVDAAGMVTGESPGGPVTITATLNGVTQTFMVTVGAPTPIGITVQPAPASRPSGVGITPPGSPAPAAVPVGR